MYRIDTLWSYKEIEGIKTIWEEIYEENHELLPFQSYSWNKCLIQNKLYKGKINFYILFKDNKAVLIAPVSKKNRIIYNEINFIGLNTHSDYLNFIYSKELTFEDFKYFISEILNENKKIVWNLTFINERSSIVEYLKRLDVAKEVHTGVCIKIPIHETKEEYANVLGTNTKKKIRVKKRYLERDFNNFNIKFYKEVPLEETLVNELMKLYCIRRKEKKNKMNEGYKRFLTQCIRDNPNLFLSTLHIDEKLATFNLGLVTTTNEICVIIVAIDSSYSKYSIGNFLIYNTINHLIDENTEIDNGYSKCKNYDLGRGEEAYKYNLGGVRHLNYYYTITNKSLFLEVNSMLRRVNLVLDNPRLLINKFTHS